MSARYPNQTKEIIDAVFCKILDCFMLERPTIQALVNYIGLKEKIRTYLLNLPNTDKLLDRCLDRNTTIGQFCAKEANRLHEFFQSGGTRLTVVKVREKIAGRTPVVQSIKIPNTSPSVVEKHMDDVNNRPGVNMEDTISIAQDIDFMFYVGCAATITIFFSILSYVCMHSKNEWPDFRP